MCGFSGILTQSKKSLSTEKLLGAMNKTLIHRGPDDQGIWYDDNHGIGLAHTRLAIVDLSPAGHQPMASANGQYIIAFNGEIYNHLQLRDELRIDTWKGHSDTETLLACFESWGIDQTLHKMTGMFAFALWDRKLNQLILARDRAGEKPLYYGWHDDTFLFGSELKALKAHPSFKKNLNREALALFLRHNYVPAPHSIYEHTYKLPPGTYLQVEFSTRTPVLNKYWSASETAIQGSQHPFQGSAHDAVDELERIAKKAVKQQMIADVSLGAFLSGGIDSSTVVALMQSQSPQPVRTFSIGFHEEQFNEAKYAKAIAEHLGTWHTEFYISNQDALAVIPKLSTLYDEPFSDSSQIPTYLVSELAKQEVTVALSGDAGDELFGGYNRYILTDRIWNKFRKVPLCVRKSAATIMRHCPAPYIDAIAAYIPKINRYSQVGVKVHKLAAVLESNSVNGVYRQLVSHHNAPYSLLTASGIEPAIFLDEEINALASLNDINRMMAMDFMSYLPDDILVKVDRAGMGVSLETRVPLLDHHLIEFAWTLPISITLAEKQSKWPLKQLLNRYVPKELFERPKMGFAIPLANWLRGPLKLWASELLDCQRLEQEGIFNVNAVNALWLKHQQGKGNYAALLWSILMFQSWWEIQ